MDKKITILGIAGSLRKDSFNKAILKEAKRESAESAEIKIFENLNAIPPFNQDNEQSLPEVVVDFKNQIRQADAILFVTPEYNYSIPGVLKNAIDWASRPYGDSAWEGKPVGIMSASIGMLGGARAQYHLRQIFVFLNMYPLNRPEIMVPFAGEKINDKGELTDNFTKEKIKEYIESLVNWTKKIKSK